MNIRNFAAAVAALTLTTTPVLAQADASRTAAPADDAESAFGSSSVLLILAIAAFGAGIFVLADNNDDVPVSP